jgi:hypothetical protein
MVLFSMYWTTDVMYWIIVSVILWCICITVCLLDLFCCFCFIASYLFIIYYYLWIYEFAQYLWIYLSCYILAWNKKVMPKFSLDRMHHRKRHAKSCVLFKNSRQLWLIWLLPKPNRMLLVITETESYARTKPYLPKYWNRIYRKLV